MSSCILVHHTEIDRVKWDNCIANSKNGIVYVYSWYLDAVFQDWEALILGDYEFVFPITRNKKFGISYFFMPIFSMQFGIFSSNEITEDIQKLFFNSLPKIKVYDFSVNPSCSYAPKRFKQTSKNCQYIDLSKSYSEINSRYSKNLVRNVTKAEKTNLKITSDSKDINSLVKFFKNSTGKKLPELKEYHYENLYQLIEHGLESNSGKIYECYDERELIASGFFSNVNKRIIYHKGGPNEKGKRYGAMHLMIDTILRENSESDLIFDFGGSTIDSVKRFNMNFGPEEYSYYNLEKCNLPFHYLRKLKNKLN